jgi:hypothetical protein
LAGGTATDGDQAGGVGARKVRTVVKRRILGGTGISVSEFALGTMMFGVMGNADHEESIRMIHTALDAGANFVDTADVYSRGESEEIVGKAIKGRRDDVVLATKFALPMGPDANQRGGSPLWIKCAVEDSVFDFLWLSEDFRQAGSVWPFPREIRSPRQGGGRDWRGRGGNRSGAGNRVHDLSGPPGGGRSGVRVPPDAVPPRWGREPYATPAHGGKPEKKARPHPEHPGRPG